jgi:hypothetical protein
MGLGRIDATKLALLTAPIIAALMRAPFFIMAPMIFIICRGVYSVSDSYFDLVMMRRFRDHSLSSNCLFSNRASSNIGTRCNCACECLEI